MNKKTPQTLSLRQKLFISIVLLGATVSKRKHKLVLGVISEDQLATNRVTYESPASHPNFTPPSIWHLPHAENIP